VSDEYQTVQDHPKSPFDHLATIDAASARAKKAAAGLSLFIDLLQQSQDPTLKQAGGIRRGIPILRCGAVSDTSSMLEVEIDLAKADPKLLPIVHEAIARILQSELFTAVTKMQQGISGLAEMCNPSSPPAQGAI
jgi:hypothetical protein